MCLPPLRRPNPYERKGGSHRRTPCCSGRIDFGVSSMALTHLGRRLNVEQIKIGPWIRILVRRLGMRNIGHEVIACHAIEVGDRIFTTLNVNSNCLLQTLEGLGRPLFYGWIRVGEENPTPRELAVLHNSGLTANSIGVTLIVLRTRKKFKGESLFWNDLKSSRYRR